MPQISRSALVRYSAESMYKLVNDVAAYPQFLPGCAESKVLETSDEHMQASILIAKAGVKQWFTTHNVLKVGKSIAMQLVEGPFSKLNGEWRFIELAEDACKIELELRFEFSSALAQVAFGKVFNGIANNMVQSFTERAKVVYG